MQLEKLYLFFSKLLYPNGEYSKEYIAEIVTIAIELLHRVKEQMKKTGSMELYNVDFSYVDVKTFEDHYISVLGDISISGTILKVEEFANMLQCA